MRIIKFLFISTLLIICHFSMVNAQSITLEDFKKQINVLSSDSSLSQYLFLYDYLNEKSLFVGYGDETPDLKIFEMTNDIGNKVYVQPLDKLFFDDIPFYLEIDDYSVKKNKTIVKFHTIGFDKYRGNTFIEGIAVFEKDSQGRWIKTFDKISEFYIKQ